MTFSVSGSPLDLSDAVIECQIRRSAGSDMLVLDIEPHIDRTNDAVGVLVVSVPPSVTATVPSRWYLWELVMSSVTHGWDQSPFLRERFEVVDPVAVP